MMEIITIHLKCAWQNKRLAILCGHSLKNKISEQKLKLLRENTLY